MIFDVSDQTSVVHHQESVCEKNFTNAFLMMEYTSLVRNVENHKTYAMNLKELSEKTMVTKVLEQKSY
jgi:hypothetical protein